MTARQALAYARHLLAIDGTEEGRERYEELLRAPVQVFPSERLLLRLVNDLPPDEAPPSYGDGYEDDAPSYAQVEEWRREAATRGAGYTKVV